MFASRSRIYFCPQARKETTKAKHPATSSVLVVRRIGCLSCGNYWWSEKTHQRLGCSAMNRSETTQSDWHVGGVCLPLTHLLLHSGQKRHAGNWTVLNPIGHKHHSGWKAFCPPLTGHGWAATAKKQLTTRPSSCNDATKYEHSIHLPNCKMTSIFWLTPMTPFVSRSRQQWNQTSSLSYSTQKNKRTDLRCISQVKSHTFGSDSLICQILPLNSFSVAILSLSWCRKSI